MYWPKASVTRSAMLVLPLPGAPNRNSPRPELMAGPSRRSIFWLISRSSNAAVQVGLGRVLVGDASAASTLSM